MRRALLRAVAGMVWGGLPPRRADQVEPSSLPGVAPGTASGIFKGWQVIIFGTGRNSGLFVYNGVPAGPVPGPANPPQVAIVASGVTADPFGNAIGLSKILIQANVITESGGVFRTSPSSPLIQLDGPHNAYLQYNAAAQLTETIAPVATSDGLGNTVQAGFTSYAPGAPSTFGQLFQGALDFGHAGNTANPIIGASGFNLVFQSGQDATHTVEATMALITALAGGTGVLRLGTLSDTALELTEVSAIPAALPEGPVLFGNGAGHAGVRSDTTHGDGVAYDIERLSRPVPSPGILINSVAFTNIPSVWTVAAGKYRIHANISLVSTFNAGAANLQVNGSATLTDMSITYKQTVKGANSIPNSQRIQALAAVITGLTFTATEQFIELDGFINFATGGTFAVQMSCTIAADTYTVITDSYVELMPVVAT
jgi:hypothetical protein